jgi:hypothetical protein
MMKALPKPRHAKPRLITTRRVVISLLLAGCAGGLIFGLSGVRNPSSLIVIDSAVKNLTPPPGTAAPRQARIGITLDHPYTLGSSTADPMSIDGQGIPQDQIEFVPGLNQFWYTPGPGKQITALPRGPNCVVITIRSVLNQADPGHSARWCFNSQ